MDFRLFELAGVQGRYGFAGRTQDRDGHAKRPVLFSMTLPTSGVMGRAITARFRRPSSGLTPQRRSPRRRHHLEKEEALIQPLRDLVDDGHLAVDGPAGVALVRRLEGAMLALRAMNSDGSNKGG